MLVYTSKSLLPIEKFFLNDILLKSREKNERDNITGFLSVRSGYFLQLLEGPKPEVLACFQRIKEDLRHDYIILQGTAEVKSRLFSSWSMGFVETKEIPNSTEEILQLFDLARDGLVYNSPKKLEAMMRIFSRKAEVINSIHDSILV